jgi:hypothetical protein
MTDFSKEHVTIAAIPNGKTHAERDQIIAKAVDNHPGEEVDLLVVVVPKDSWRDARGQIFDQFGIKHPVVLGQARRDELDQATAYEGNLSRMFGEL